MIDGIWSDGLACIGKNGVKRVTALQRSCWFMEAIVNHISNQRESDLKETLVLDELVPYNSKIPYSFSLH